MFGLAPPGNRLFHFYVSVVHGDWATGSGKTCRRLYPSALPPFVSRIDIRLMVRAIFDPDDSPETEPTRFSPVQATRTLPLVRRIVADMLRLQESMGTQQEQIREIDRMTHTIANATYEEELSDIRASLELDQARMDSFFAELSMLGVNAHEPFDGSIDFPAVMNRQPVYLCWRPEDECVEFWHQPGQPSEQRKKLDASDLAAIAKV